eukprot:5724415-Pyramimonas_sp.AAC.1
MIEAGTEIGPSLAGEQHPVGVRVLDQPGTLRAVSHALFRQCRVAGRRLTFAPTCKIDFLSPSVIGARY